MFYLLLLIFFTYTLAHAYQNQSVYLADHSKKRCGFVAKRANEKLIYFLIVMIFVLFSGLRSVNNDTRAYIAGFLYQYNGYLSEIKNINFSIEDGYLFAILNVLGKAVFGNNYARFLTFVALLTCGSYLKFFRKYSSDFSLAVYLLITSTFFNFSMAALRQCLAVAVAIWAIPCFCQKKYFRGFFYLAIGTLLHEFVILFAVALFLKNDVWNKKTVLIVAGTVVVSFGFSAIFASVAKGTGYAESDLVVSAGTSVLRTLVWLIPVALSLLYRNSVNEKCDVYAKTFINLSLIGSMIMVLASFGGANLIARTAYYFYPFFILAFTEIITGAMDKKDAGLFRRLCMFGFFAYFVILNRGKGGFFVDYYRHNSILDLFRKTVK